MSKLLVSGLLAASALTGLVFHAAPARAAALPAEGVQCQEACEVSVECLGEGRCRVVCRGEGERTCEVVLECPAEARESCRPAEACELLRRACGADRG